MDSEYISIMVQVIAALGVIASVFYLSLQIRQQNKITRAEFGHHLTERLYNRYFQTVKDREYCEFLSQDWSAEEDRTAGDYYRITHFLAMCLVDIRDVYEKVNEGIVDERHLTLRVNALKLGTMKSGIAMRLWGGLRADAEDPFVTWFESEIYDGNFKAPDMDDELARRLNARRD